MNATERALVITRMSSRIMANSDLSPELAKEMARRWLKA